MDFSKLKPEDFPEQRPGASQVECVIEWVLARKGSKAHKAGVYILTRGGPKLIPDLARAACNPDRKPAHCIRLLDVILEIGGPLSTDSYSELCELLYHRSEKVADKVKEVLTTLGPDEPPALLPPELLEQYVEDCRRQVGEVNRLFGLAP